MPVLFERFCTNCNTLTDHLEHSGSLFCRTCGTTFDAAAGFSALGETITEYTSAAAVIDALQADKLSHVSRLTDKAIGQVTHHLHTPQGGHGLSAEVFTELLPSLKPVETFGKTFVVETFTLKFRITPLPPQLNMRDRVGENIIGLAQRMVARPPRKVAVDGFLEVLNAVLDGRVRPLELHTAADIMIGILADLTGGPDVCGVCGGSTVDSKPYNSGSGSQTIARPCRCQGR